MKKLVFVFITALLVACGGKGGDTVIGNWQLDSVSGEELTESEKSTVFKLAEDGTFTRERGGEAKTGKWEWSEDKKNIILKRDGGREEVMENVKVEGDKMTFKADEDEITLKKI